MMGKKRIEVSLTSTGSIIKSINPKWEISINVELGEGWVGKIPWILYWSAQTKNVHPLLP